MKNGFRVPAEESKKEKIRQLNAQVANLEMSTQVSQMMIKQLLTSNQNQAQDLGRALNLINELQYKLLAVQTVAKLDVNALNDEANKLRLKDFDEASDKEDATNNFTIGEKVEENSTVIITTTLENGETGIFRSRLSLPELGFPAIVNGLLGQSVGTKFDADLNGVKHTIELLGIRNPPPEVKEEAAPEATA